MTKIETTTFEYEQCGECYYADHHPTRKYPKRHRCFRTGRVIPSIWGAMPDWCPLEDKELK